MLQVRSHAKACCRSFKNLLGELYGESARVEREKRFQLAQIAEAQGGVAGFKVSCFDFVLRCIGVMGYACCM